MAREAGSKVVDGKVVPPAELPELGSSNDDKAPEPMTDGRLSIEPVFNGILVKVAPATVLNARMKPVALLQAMNKLNQWVTLHEISPAGGKCTIKPPKKNDGKVIGMSDAANEYVAVRLMEGTCTVKFGGNDE